MGKEIRWFHGKGDKVVPWERRYGGSMGKEIRWFHGKRNQVVPWERRYGEQDTRGCLGW